MKKKNKLLTTIMIVISSVILISAVLLIAAKSFLWQFHEEITSLKPDVSGWILSNEDYTIIPVVNDYVTFHVENNQGEIVFTCRESWRSWDFKSLSIDNKSDINVNSSDTGIVVYKYENGTWVKDY